ncbi:MAG: DUF975 family protein [Clostridia bacterium]|nr:DUF975 family protein [Clostridia bacterium]
MDRISLKTAAKEQIKGKIGILFIISIIVVGISFIAGMILGFIPFIGGIISSIFITPAFSLSIVLVYLKVADGKTPVAGDAFEGFYDFWSAFKVTFFVNLFTTLWSLLFIVPGIIKSFSYSMAMYILAENKGMSALEAINKSKAMMDGKKMDLFVLGLSFIGWSLLCFITFGIASIWVVPYMSATYTNFYKALKPVETIEATETVVE